MACWLCWLESLRIPTRHIFTCAVSLLLATSTHLQHCPFLGFPFGSHSLPFFPFQTSSWRKDLRLSKWLGWLQVTCIFKSQRKGASYTMYVPRGAFMPVFVCFHYCIFPLGTWGNRWRRRISSQASIWQTLLYLGSIWGSLRLGHDWATSLSLFTFMHWRRKWQPTPEFLPGESQGRGSLAGFCLRGHTELDATEAT